MGRDWDENCSTEGCHRPRFCPSPPWRVTGVADLSATDGRNGIRNTSHCKGRLRNTVAPGVGDNIGRRGEFWAIQMTGCEIGTHPFSVRNRLRGGEGMGSCSDSFVVVCLRQLLTCLGAMSPSYPVLVPLLVAVCTASAVQMSVSWDLTTWWGIWHRKHTLRAPSTLPERGTASAATWFKSEKLNTVFSWWPGYICHSRSTPLPTKATRWMLRQL